MSAPSPAPGPAERPAGELPASAYRRMSLVLRVGLLGALALFAAGLAALVARHGSSASGGWVRPNALAGYLDLRHLGGALAAGTPEAYLTLGVLVLIATPVLRVVGGALAFAGHGERRMALLSLAVLAMLLLGLFVLGPVIR